ncbi:18357_t:CDS:2, partial [Gigaspora rosea]
LVTNKMDHNEASDYFSISESGSFTSELTNYEEDTVSKIAKLKKMIAELEISLQQKVQIEDKFSYNKTSKVITNKANKVQTIDEISNNRGSLKQNRPQVSEENNHEFSNVDKIFNDKLKKGSLKRSHLQVSEENDTEFSSDDPEQPVFKRKNINYQKILSFLHIPKRLWSGYV